MALPENIKRDHILNAINEIDEKGVTKRAQSSTYDLVFNDKRYPPKLVLSLANKYANGKELDRKLFEGGDDTRCFMILRDNGFVIIDKDFQIGPKKAYLLTWNPNNWAKNGFTMNGINIDDFSEQIRWSCSNTNIKVGDTIYLMRLGVPQRGLVAKGRVSKESYEDKNWKEASESKIKYINFVFEFIRDSSDKGMIKCEDLEKRFPKQRWTPQASGIQIKDEYINDLNNLWNTLTGKHNTMEEYFKKEHFDLIEQYAGEKYNSNDSKDKEVRNKLKGAYNVTHAWAIKVQEMMFPNGAVKIRKNPINQGQRFEEYTWAKIYPSSEALDYKKVAYTVGIHGKGFHKFFVKIDTVGLSENDNLRQHYLRMRGDLLNSKLVYHLSEEEGLSLSLDELVAWSTESIKKLEPYFNELIKWERSDSIKLGEQDMSLNLILFGPPGTGKTYRTIDKALEIVDPEFYYEKKNNRSELKARFDQYRKEGIISFVTFHQSFSYEDFVEGLRAESSDDNNGIHYYIADGIFKQICDTARTGHTSTDIDTAIARFVEQVIDEPIQLQTSTGNNFTVSYRGGVTFIIKPELSEKGQEHRASIERIKRVYRGEDARNVYNPSYVKGILNHLKEKYNLPDESSIENDLRPSVLIIDEINRGNTANIFGELITLIEPSKRQGNDESLKVTLPYSKEQFDVPNNLYIIGTMNTADRSLTLLDTALRRRFDFEYVGPDINILKENEITDINGINIPLMLETINKRIELLYDRDHTIGHTFFLQLKTDKSINRLAHIFKHNILPLLEEYFFEDWSKIQQVLGDNLKADDDTKFILSKFANNDIESLLGEEMAGILGEKVFTQNSTALSNPQSYIGIYEND